MTHESIGMILSLIGMAVCILSFQIRKKTWFLAAQSLGSGIFLISYIFSGGGMAIWLNCVYLIRNFVFVRLDKMEERVKRKACYLFWGVFIAVYLLYLSFSGETFPEAFWSFLPAFGSLFTSYAYTQTDVIKLRLIKIVDSGCWISYNLHVGIGALGGVLCEVFSLTSIAISIWRFRRDDKKALPQA